MSFANQSIYVVSAVRTAIGAFGGSLKDTPLSGLATHVVAESVRRAGLVPELIEHVVMGNVIPTEPSDAYLSRVAALGAGMRQETPAFNVNRLCGSGLQAIVSAAQLIALGDAEIAVGAGAESMSRGPYISKSLRWGARMGNVEALDFMLGVLHDPFSCRHMGVTAENVAERYKVSRETQDRLALTSQQRAARAVAEGRFKDQIAGIEIRVGKKTQLFDTDEHIRSDTSIESLTRLRPAFAETGSVTAGNSSGINDGAAAVVLASENAVAKHGLKPLARLVAYGQVGVDPQFMGIGPVPASRLALARAGLKVDDIALIEANEAFAAQACAVIQEMKFDPERVNPNGSGISLGHPVGATGAILATKAVHELKRAGGRYALATMCIGGGQGIALILERA
ncbi:MAG TPA: acetyl-CoA C-acyltransferase family protein [Steroidobacteraceae bacterium]